MFTNIFKPSVFICYRKTESVFFAKDIYNALKKRGYRVFFDDKSLQNGFFDSQIYDAIKNSKDFVLLLSNHTLDSYQSEGNWIRKELEIAQRYNTHITIVSDSIYKLQHPLLPSLEFLDNIPIIYIEPKLFDSSIDKLCKNLKSKVFGLKKVSICLVPIMLVLVAYFVLTQPGQMQTANLNQDDYHVPIPQIYDNEIALENYDFKYFNLPSTMEIQLQYCEKKDSCSAIYFIIDILESWYNTSDGKSQVHKDSIEEVMKTKRYESYLPYIKQLWSKNNNTLKSEDCFDLGIHKWAILKYYNKQYNCNIYDAITYETEADFLHIIIIKPKNNFSFGFINDARFKNTISTWDPFVKQYFYSEFN